MLPHSLTSVLELSITRCPLTFKEHNPVPDITDICISAVTFGREITWNCSIAYIEKTAPLGRPLDSLLLQSIDSASASHYGV